MSDDSWSVDKMPADCWPFRRRIVSVLCPLHLGVKDRQSLKDQLDGLYVEIEIDGEGFGEPLATLAVPTTGFAAAWING